MFGHDKKTLSEAQKNNSDEGLNLDGKVSTMSNKSSRDSQEKSEDQSLISESHQSAFKLRQSADHSVSSSQNLYAGLNSPEKQSKPDNSKERDSIAMNYI